MVNYGLNGRVAIVTGANNPQGIGAATALAFAREGAKVVLVYKRLPRAYDESKIEMKLLHGTHCHYVAQPKDGSECPFGNIAAEFIQKYLK